MPLIGHPIGDLDEYIIISEIYKPDDFEAGWYFVPHDFPLYTFVSTDVDPNIEEVIVDGDKVKIQGFDPYLENISFPEGYKPSKREFIKEQKNFHYPSGVPYEFTMGYYWEMFGDLDSPYMFIPYFNPNTYGQIVWLDFNTPLERFNNTFTVIEHLLQGIVFPFKEKTVTDANWSIPLKEKIVSLLSCDIEMVAPNTLKLKWSGEKVPFIEILRKEISDNSFGNPIAVVPYDDGEYVFTIDNNSYIYSVRGSNGTGMSNVEVTIGVRGKTTIKTEVSLGDFVKIYEGDIGFVDSFEAEILI